MRGKRDPDTGEIIEVESRLYKDSESGRQSAETPRRKARGGEEPPTDPIPGAKRAGRVPRAAPPPRSAPPPPAAKTEPLSAPRHRERKARASEEPKTRPYRPGSDAPVSGAEAAGAEDTMNDAIVGWLVVVDGPGKGEVRRLGYGVNTLGRGGNARVQIDFGDEEISRESHATVTYDPKGRRFYLQHGGGRNLTYVGDEPVLAPTPLEACQHIVLGQTTFRFIALCGSDFDWQDLG